MIENDQIVRTALKLWFPYCEIYRMVDNVQEIPFGVPRTPVGKTPRETRQIIQLDYFDIETYDLNNRIVRGNKVLAHWGIDHDKQWILYSLVN